MMGYILNTYRTRALARAALGRYAKRHGHTALAYTGDDHASLLRSSKYYRCRDCHLTAHVTREGNIYSYNIELGECAEVAAAARARYGEIEFSSIRARYWNTAR